MPEAADAPRPDDEAADVTLDVAIVARRSRMGACGSGGVTVVMASWYDGGTEMGSWNH